MIIKDSDNTASHVILGHEFPELNSSPLSSILAQENRWNLALCGHDPFSNSKCNLPWSNSTKDWLRPLNTLLNLHAPCLQNDAGRRCDSVHSLFLSFIPHLSWNTVMVEGWISFEKDSILYALWQQDDDSSSTNLSHGHLHISPCSPLGKRRAIQEGERERKLKPSIFLFTLKFVQHFPIYADNIRRPVKKLIKGSRLLYRANLCCFL